MSITWLILAGLLPAFAAYLVLPTRKPAGLFVLGLGGAWITGMMQYSLGQEPGFLVPLIGAVALLALHAFTSRPSATRNADRDDFHKAA
jgi:uncharacterized membrane protein YeaQ/YmgE (transglycosylase-associated protein family)